MTQSIPAAPSSFSPHERHFRTDHLTADLKGRSARGAAVTVSAQAVKFVLQLGSTAVLARLLTPADFGLVAMVAAVTGFAGLFKDLGLSLATVQRIEITHEQVSTLFWINAASSFALTLICAAVAPLVAWFYREPRLVSITLVISVTFLIGGLTAQHKALLERQMCFGALAIVDVFSMTCGACVSILLALKGAGYWALVTMTATQALVGMGGIWIASGWWPGRARRNAGVRPMLRFGSSLTGFSILNYFTRNFDNILVGAFLGAGPLGLYSRAYGLLMLPISQINAPVAAVALPALCRLQHDPAQYRRFFLRAVEIVAFCGMPIVAFAFVEAHNLVALLLGHRWSGAVPIFRWLAPAAFVGTLNVAPGWLCASLGWTHRQLRWAMLSAPVTVLAFAIGLNWGAVGVAAGFTFSWCTLLLIFIGYSCHGSPVRIQDIGQRIWRTVVASLAAALAITALPKVGALSGQGIANLALSSCCFVLAFFGTFIVLPKGITALRELLLTVRILRQRAV